LEELTVRDETVIVDVVDLECKSKLVFLAGARAERIEPLDELQEADITVVVTVQHGDDTLHQRVVRQLWNLKEFRRFECTTLITINLAEVLVQLLKFTLAKVQVLELSLFLCQLVTHCSRNDDDACFFRFR